MTTETCTCAPIPGEATLRVVDRDCPEHGVGSAWYAEHGNKIQWPTPDKAMSNGQTLREFITDPRWHDEVRREIWESYRIGVRSRRRHAHRILAAQIGGMLLGLVAFELALVRYAGL